MVAIVPLLSQDENEQERELTVEKVARRLRLSKMSVLRRIKEKKLRVRVEGRSWYVLESDLKTYIRKSFSDTSQQ